MHNLMRPFLYVERWRIVEWSLIFLLTLSYFMGWGIKYLFMGDQVKGFEKYSELDMSFLLGVSCGFIPFANHDHARRVLYQSEKHSGKTLILEVRTHTLFHQCTTLKGHSSGPWLPILGKPGCQFGGNQILLKAEFFNGQNTTVAVNVYFGYNQEDSMIMNRSSLDHGMFRIEHVRSHKAEVNSKEPGNKWGKSEGAVSYGKIQSKLGRVDSLDDDGFPYVGANFQSGDIVVGRCSESCADHSIKLKHTEKGRVEKVLLSANDDGKIYAIVSLSQVRSPRLGTSSLVCMVKRVFFGMHGKIRKFSVHYARDHSRYSINPHAVPSRQTPAQLLEAALGKGIARGAVVVRQDMLPRSLPPLSKPSLSSFTGPDSEGGVTKGCTTADRRDVRTLIFLAPTFYQHLVHMAEGKVKFRNTGPVHLLTRQPVSE